MITKKKDAVEKLEIWKRLIQPFINKSCTVKFDMHTSTGFIISELKLQAYNATAHKPNAREFEGKNKRPMLFTLVNNQCPFIFALDDTEIVGIGNGIRITVALDKPLNNKDCMEIDIRLE